MLPIIKAMLVGRELQWQNRDLNNHMKSPVEGKT